MNESPITYCACGIPWEGPEGFCAKCKKEISPNRYEATRKKIELGIEPCDCGYPTVGQTNFCERCKKVIPWNRLESLGLDTDKIRKHLLTLEEDSKSNNQITSSLDPHIFCVNCGGSMDSQSNFCAICGKPNDLKTAPIDTPHQTEISKKQVNRNSSIPEEIRQNLNKHQSHRQVTCLECGYVGLMGILGIIENKSKSWPIYLFAGFIGLFGVPILGPAGLIVALIVGGLIGAILGSQDNANRKARVECPNCLRELQI